MTDGFFCERWGAKGFMLSFPLEVESRDKIHEGQPCRHALDLLLVAAIAFSNDITIELECSEEAHLGVVHQFLLYEVKFANALVVELRYARQQAHLILVASGDVFQLRLDSQVCLKNLLVNFESKAIIGVGEFLLLFSPDSQQVLIYEWQRVALQVDLLLYLLHCFVNFIHINLHAQQFFLQAAKL